tara:strand:- start:4733 stop:4870 length:138 start_codon:yes stop_codon:yes gene_type:complete
MTSSLLPRIKIFPRFELLVVVSLIALNRNFLHHLSTEVAKEGFEP